MQAWFASLLILLGGGTMLWHATDQGRALTAESARRLTAATSGLPVSPFTLETMTGAQAHVPDPGKVAIVEFIYTSCPAVCQSAGADMFRLGERLRGVGLDGKVALYSITFDPRFDTLERLASYGERHHADEELWSAARPRAEALPRILDQFGVIVLPDDFGGYTHNVAVHVVSPAGRIVGIHEPREFDAIVASTRNAL